MTVHPHTLGRFAESRRVQASEQRCFPALPVAAWGEKESAGEKQQTHVVVPGQRSTPGPPRHQREVRKTNRYRDSSCAYIYLKRFLSLVKG